MEIMTLEEYIEKRYIRRSVYMPVKMDYFLKAKAAEEGVSVSRFVSDIIADYIEATGDFDFDESYGKCESSCECRRHSSDF